MLTELTLKGFKSFLRKTIDLNGLTVLTGLNSSGKSTVIQALLMLEKASKNETNIMLTGHGAIEEIRNIYFKDEISLSVKENSDKYFHLKLPLFSDSFKPYETKIEGDFEFPEIIYISANRFGPKTSIPVFNDGYMRKRIGPNGENLLHCIELLADEPLNSKLRHANSEGDTLLYNIRGWLSVISPNVKFDYAVSKMSDSSFSLFNEHRSTNVGFGLSYVLPVITALLVGTLTPNSVVIIENPEAHLHPRGQTEIATLVSLCADVGAQIIVETHSDHLFDGIRIGAKNIVDFNKKVNIHWFETDERGITDVYSPELLANGRIDDWPKGLFDQFEINASKLI